MKFIAVLRPKESLSMLPPDALLKIWEASIPGMQKLKQEGKQTNVWASPTGCAVSMLNYDNADQWLMDQVTIPILNYYTQEIFPVTDLMTIMTKYMDAFKQVKK
jgi:hypothetical protein